jgi:hypothetical protein
MVAPQQTPIHSKLINPSGRDLYEKFNFSLLLFDPPHASNTTGAEEGQLG